MIGAFYIAEQYLQRVAGFSALGASAALVLVALLVGAAAPLAGRLVDRHGEQLPALLGLRRRRRWGSRSSGSRACRSTAWSRCCR